MNRIFSDISANVLLYVHPGQKKQWGSKRTPDPWAKAYESHWTKSVHRIEGSEANVEMWKATQRQLNFLLTQIGNNMEKLQFLKYFLYHSLTWNSENGTPASDTVGQLWDYTTLAASTSFSMPVWSLADPCYCPLSQSHCQDTRGLQTRGADAGVWIVAVKPEKFSWEHVGNQSPYAGLPG